MIRHVLSILATVDKNILSTIQDIAISIITVFIGAVLGYFYSVRLNKKNKKVAYFKDLTQLIKLVESALEYTYSVLEKYNGLSEKIKNRPYELHFNEVALSFDFDRIKNLNSHQIFEAYTAVMKIDKIDDYLRLFKCIDFVHFKLNKMYEIHNNQNKFIFEDQSMIVDLIDKMGSLMYKSIDNIEKKKIYKNEKNIAFSKIKDLVLRLRNNSFDISNYNDSFIMPVTTYCKEAFSFDEEAVYDILFLANKSSDRYSQIETNSKLQHERCINLKNEILPSLEEMKSIISNIKVEYKKYFRVNIN